jgi:hypothetical protein
LFIYPPRGCRPVLNAGEGGNGDVATAVADVHAVVADIEAVVADTHAAIPDVLQVLRLGHGVEEALNVL